MAPYHAAYDTTHKYKTTHLIVESADMPGMLNYILSAFEIPNVADSKKRLENIDVMNMRPLQPTPFIDDRSHPHVHVATGEDPYDITRQVLSQIDLSAVKGKRVLLKPNAGRIATAGSGITTNPGVVAAAIDAFLEAEASVAVGESPITGVKTLEAFEATGIASVARERNCPLIVMDARQPVHVIVEDGVAIQSLEVCPEVVDYDVVVSIPVMKTHMHTVVTLAVKNMKGCLWRRTKVDLHMLPPIEDMDDKSLNIAIADMASVLRPHLSIIDGTTGMEGLGPSAGQAKKLDLVVAGIDPLAVDAVACSLMGVNAEDVPHLRICAERGYGVIDISRIQVNPARWLDFTSPFELPPDNLSIHFSGITILDEMSCSACQSTVFMLLNRYGKQVFDSFPGQENVVIAIGKGHQSVPCGTLCIGNCTAQHKKQGVFVPGCPPVATHILEMISESKPKENPDVQTE